MNGRCQHCVSKLKAIRQGILPFNIGLFHPFEPSAFSAIIVNDFAAHFEERNRRCRWSRSFYQHAAVLKRRNRSPVAY